jgi:hypothetical protein
MHDIVDVVRDVLSAIVAGLFLAAVGGVIADRRAIKKRLDRHSVEIRHTQREAKVEPFYSGDDL